MKRGSPIDPLGSRSEPPVPDNEFMNSLFEWPGVLMPSEREQCEKVHRLLLRKYDSYGLLGGLFAAELEPTRFYATLGQIWSDCDNIAEYASQLKAKFRQASRGHLDLMMADDELSEWQELPKSIRAYRFAYDNNLQGFSYSLDKTIAESFKDNPRYTQHSNPSRFLITVDIPKKWAVVKLGRDELEIIAVRPGAIKMIKKTRL